MREKDLTKKELENLVVELASGNNQLHKRIENDKHTIGNLTNVILTFRESYREDTKILDAARLSLNKASGLGRTILVLWGVSIGMLVGMVIGSISSAV